MKKNEKFFKRTRKERDGLALLRVLFTTTALIAALTAGFVACDLEVENTNAIATVEISGTAEVGGTLTAVAKDAAGDEVDDAEFQWVSGTSDYSTTALGFFQAIEGATGSSYTITAEDSTNFIRVKAINDATKEENLFWGAVYSSTSKWAGPSATTLTTGTWADGNITAAGGEQWFKFTATAATQYIHVNSGTLTDLYVQVYNSSGEGGAWHNLDGSTICISAALTSGKTYYVKVWPYYWSGSGTYQIAFNTSATPPEDD